MVFNSRAFRGIFTGWMCLIKLENEVDTWLMAHSLIGLSNATIHTKIKPLAQPLWEEKALVLDGLLLFVTQQGLFYEKWSWMSHWIDFKENP